MTGDRPAVRAVQTSAGRTGGLVYPLSVREAAVIRDVVSRLLHAKVVGELTLTDSENAVLSTVWRLAKPVPQLVPEMDVLTADADDWIGTGKAAQRLGITDRAVRKAIARGVLDARRGKGGLQVNERQLDAWGLTRRTKVSTECPSSS